MSGIRMQYGREMKGMALQLYMLGLIVQDIGKAAEFYRRLGLVVPEDTDATTHIQIKMESGLTLFLDSRPAAWESKASTTDQPERVEATRGAVLEFYLTSRAEVDVKFVELTRFGYAIHRKPFETPFGMYFAMINDPDGNTVLLSAP
jgi:predicted lactoylglutathione lyase